MDVVTESVPAAPYSPWRGLWEVFVNPARVGKAIAEKPIQLIPAIMLVLVYLAIFFVIKDLVVELSRQQMAEQAANGGPTVDPDKLEKMTTIFGLTGSVFTSIVLPMVVGFMVWLVGSFGMGMKADFARTYSAALYSGWLYGFGSLLLAPLAVINGHLGFTVSPAVLLGEPDMKNLFWIILSKFSLFQIWEVIALGFLATEIFRTTRNKGYIIAVISLGTIIGIGVLFAALGSMMRPS